MRRYRGYRAVSRDGDVGLVSGRADVANNTKRADRMEED